MGSLSAMNSINRVLEAHDDEIIAECSQMVPDSIRDQFDTVILENNLYSITTSWQFKDGSLLPGPPIDIDTLAGKYPDCQVGY